MRPIRNFDPDDSDFEGSDFESVSESEIENPPQAEAETPTEVDEAAKLALEKKNEKKRKHREWKNAYNARKRQEREDRLPLGNMMPADYMKKENEKFKGPRVTFLVCGKVFELPKNLICEKSPFFASMLSGNFKEGPEHGAVLREEAGIVTIPIFCAFLHWLYNDRLDIAGAPEGLASSEDQLSLLIELARFADMILSDHLTKDISLQIKYVISHPPPPSSFEKPPLDSGWKAWDHMRHPDINTVYFDKDTIEQAMMLPRGNAIRDMVVNACLEGYLRKRPFKYRDDAVMIPGFAAEMLEKAADVIADLTYGQNEIHFEEPITGKKLAIQRRQDSRWARSSRCTRARK